MFLQQHQPIRLLHVGCGLGQKPIGGDTNRAVNSGQEEIRAKEEEIAPWFCTSDPEAIDEEVDRFLSPPECMETYLITDVIERAKQEKPLRRWEEVPTRTGGYVPYTKDMTNEYLEEQSLLEFIEEVEGV